MQKKISKKQIMKNGSLLQYFKNDLIFRKSKNLDRKVSYNLQISPPNTYKTKKHYRCINYSA